MQAAVLKRANVLDVLVCKNNVDFLAHSNGTIATGSLRRQAMWLNRYPSNTVVDLRGNVQTRLQKLQDNNWQGAVFAAAGLDRLNLKLATTQTLDWMVPAPAQGAMVVHAMQHDEYCKNAVAELNDLETDICTYIERQFLKTLEGGCTAPIGALAVFNDVHNTINFKGILLSIDGSQKIEVNKTVDISEWKKLGFHLAQEILNDGGRQLMKEIKTTLKRL
jgi:hydroxymethylbilane synthase